MVSDSTQTDSPLAIVLFGATGDLAKKKLFNALFALYLEKRLPESFVIIGVASNVHTNDSFRKHIKAAITNESTSDSEIQAFVDCAAYISGDFTEPETFIKIAEALENIHSSQVGIKTLFYLATPPQLYKSLLTSLHSSHLLSKCESGNGWGRVLIEKPFGTTCEEAAELEHIVQSHFRNDQVFRIDHYLAKEAVQNILSFRFANPLIASAWTPKHINSISISLHETTTVENRASFYDAVGALRDVGENHALQLLALATIATPKTFSADDISLERQLILENIAPHTPDKHFIRGQYDAYRTHEGVRSESNTETFFTLETRLMLPDWEHIPIYLEGGKALSENMVEIHISFSTPDHTLFSDQSCAQKPNHITLTISPTQKITVQLNTKKTGLGYTLETQDFVYDCGCTGHDAYEKVLLDAIMGDRTLFPSHAEVAASWRYIQSVRAHENSTALTPYKEGSTGPDGHNPRYT